MHLTVIGQLRLGEDGRKLELPSRPARWLLGCLALSPDLRADRTTLASQFWEERPDARARQNLRQALHALRQTLEPGLLDAIQSSREYIWLDASRVSIDLDALFAELDRGETPEVLVMQAGLPGLILADIDPPGNLFASWLHLRRMEIESRLREKLNANMARQTGKPAVRMARALLALDPSDENACRALMRESVRAGATARALEAYAQLWNHLDEEYGIEPSHETQKLVAEIKMQPDAPVPPPAPAQRPRIRVGMLETTGTDADAAQVLRLFRTELISRLVRFREWQIFDAQFQSSECEYELRLSGTTIAGRISVVAVLTDVRDGRVVWGETSQGVAKDWLDFHTRIASRLASSCNINVSFSRLASLAAQPAESAFDNWLLGQTRMLRFRREDLDEAMRFYEAAARHDPGFARAYSSQSQLLNIRHLCVPGMMRDAGTINRSLALANKAVSIDPADAQAHLCRGWACMHLGEWAHAQVSFDLALRCNQDDPWAIISIALAAAFRGEHQRATELSDRFLDEGWTNSAINWGYLANIRFLAGDFHGSAAAADSAGAASLNIPAWHAAALANLGQMETAAAQWQVFEDLVRPQWSGTVPASTAAIREWLLSGFPIRRDAERLALANGVDMAIARLGGRHAHCAQV